MMILLGAFDVNVAVLMMIPKIVLFVVFGDHNFRAGMAQIVMMRIFRLVALEF